jgi:hypothetical protein
MLRLTTVPVIPLASSEATKAAVFARSARVETPPPTNGVPVLEGVAVTVMITASVESVDLRRLCESASGDDVLGDNLDGCRRAPGEKALRSL